MNISFTSPQIQLIFS